MKWSHCYTSLADPSLSLPRFGHSAVCVNAKANWGSDLVVVYGGVGSAAGETAQTALGDVVVLQVDSGTWSVPDLLPGPSPGARAFHCAVALGQQLLLFGGHILTFDAEHSRKRRTFFNDVWQLDTNDWQWSKLPVDAAAPSPLGRDMASLLLLDESTLLLFGGRSEAGKSLQDCWLFDVDRCCWQHLKPEGPLPPARKMHGMVKLGSQVVLFGGERDSGPLDDLWVLRGWQPGATPRWTQVKVKASPVPRFGHTLAVVSMPSPAQGTATSEAGGSSTGNPDESGTAAAATSAGSTIEAAAAAAGQDPTGSAAATPRASSSGGIAATAASEGQQQQRVVLFGGCLDLSSFLSLNRNYVQSKEAWLLDMSSLTWVQLPAVDEAGSGPCERMCHSLTPLPDGRMLLLGGRQKEGICKDMWWLDAACDLTVPRSPSGSQLSLTGSATSARPSSQQSLLQSLLGPMRSQRDTSQGGQPAATAAAAATPPAVSNTSSTPDLLSLPDSPHKQQQHQQQQDQLQHEHVAPASAAAIQAASDSARQQQQQQRFAAGAGSSGGSLSAANQEAAAPPPPLPDLPPPYPGATGAAANPYSSTAYGQQQQLQQQPPSPAAYISTSSSSSSTSQPLAALMDAGLGSGELAKLIRNPAAYSADAINKLSNSVSSTVAMTVNSLLAGREGQAGALAGALPAALSRVAPSLLTPTAAAAAAQRAGSSTPSRPANPAVAALRALLGLPAMPQQPAVSAPAGASASAAAVAASASAAAAAPCMAPGVVLQELARLGQQLLGDDGSTAGSTDGGGGFTSSSSIPPDVLVSAARQHLMSSAVAQLQVAQVVLLLADYQHLAATYFEHQLLARLSQGFAAATSDAEKQSSMFLQRQPQDLLLRQVQQLQAEYKQLIMSAA